MSNVKILASQIVKGVVHRTCPHCGRTMPLSEFGLRRFRDGAVSNQSWCISCRNGK